MNPMLRKTVLSVADLAITGGVFAGPIAAHAAEPMHAAEPVHAAPAVEVQADKPDMGKHLIEQLTPEEPEVEAIGALTHKVVHVDAEVEAPEPEPPRRRQ
ncbi:hypothetical protein [Micromonospora sp. SL4-19]|uniref:hypothetical protein n=1 Tax=Micromonospora sp. SL4-19 TaxID=3399129 RepID=UPI003A4D7B5E